MYKVSGKRRHSPCEKQRGGGNALGGGGTTDGPCGPYGGSLMGDKWVEPQVSIDVWGMTWFGEGGETDCMFSIYPHVVI